MSLFYILLPYISLLCYLLELSSTNLTLFSTIAVSVGLMVLLVKYLSGMLSSLEFLWSRCDYTHWSFFRFVLIIALIATEICDRGL